MEYILLLTACINPDGMPFTCLADVGVRKKQYIEALNFYLKNTTRKIVFVENSGTDISSSFKDFQHRIEFLCFDGNLCFDKRKGKGYGEALILEYAMAKSEFITDDVLIFKLTGRLQLININRLIHYMDKLSPYTVILYICDMSDGKQAIRNRLFSMWYYEYEQRESFTFLSTKVEVESTDYYASVLVKNSNPQLEDIKVAFNSFIENMKEKLE